MELVNNLKDSIIKRKNECIDQLGIKLRKAAKEKRTLFMQLKSKTKNIQINEVSDGVEKDIIKENKYKCKQCPFKTNILALMGKHILHKHRNQHKCPECDKMFSFKEPLKRHMKRIHEIIIIGKRDGSLVGPKKDCAECKIKDEVLKHKEDELDKKEKQIKKLTPKNNEFRKCKEEVDKARKTIAENVKLMNLLIIERDTLKARADMKENTEHEVQEVVQESNEIPEIVDFKCKRCGYINKTIEELRKHMEDMHKSGVACQSCNKSFLFKSDMLKHKRIMHDRPTFVCKICDGVFQNSRGLRDHKQKPCRTNKRQTTEVSRAELKCDHCDYGTNNQGQFIIHMTNHISTNQYKCKTCGEQFKEKCNLINHQVTTHCICSFCNSHFNNINEKDKHICNMHPNKTVHEQRRALRRKSTDCTAGQQCEHYRRGRCLFRHSPNEMIYPQGGQSQRRQEIWCKYQERCDRRHSCPYRHHNSEGGLEDHGDQEGRGGQGGQADMGSHRGQGGHGEQGPTIQSESAAEWLPRLKCQKCKYETNNQNELIYHMDTKHLAAKYKCDNCSNSFVNSENLVNHIVNAHTAILPQNQGFMNHSFQENF